MWGKVNSCTNSISTKFIFSHSSICQFEFQRATASQENIAGLTYTFGYGYDLSGALTSETYPSGRIVNTAYDPAGRASQVSGGYATEQTTYFSDAAYEPDGQPAWFLYGNGLCRSFGYNSRMQLASSADSVVQGAAPQAPTCFNAGQQPLALAYNSTASNGKNDGNLWGMTTY